MSNLTIFIAGLDNYLFDSPVIIEPNQSNPIDLFKLFQQHHQKLSAFFLQEIKQSSLTEFRVGSHPKSDNLDKPSKKVHFVDDTLSQPRNDIPYVAYVSKLLDQQVQNIPVTFNPLLLHDIVSNYPAGSTYQQLMQNSNIPPIIDTSGHLLLLMQLMDIAQRYGKDHQIKVHIGYATSDICEAFNKFLGANTRYFLNTMAIQTHCHWSGRVYHYTPVIQGSRQTAVEDYPVIMSKLCQLKQEFEQRNQGEQVKPDFYAKPLPAPESLLGQAINNSEPLAPLQQQTQHTSANSDQPHAVTASTTAGMFFTSSHKRQYSQSLTLPEKRICRSDSSDNDDAQSSIASASSAVESIDTSSGSDDYHSPISSTSSCEAESIDSSNDYHSPSITSAAPDVESINASSDDDNYDSDSSLHYSILSNSL